MMRAAGLILLLLMACRASDLADNLDRVLVAGVPSGGLAGVAVVDGSGRILYARNADQPLSLASTTKILVSAAALLALGPDFNFRTRVHALGPLASGVVPGLGVVGGGDPCLDGHQVVDGLAIGAGDPDRVFAGWAARLKSLGVVRISGDLVVDARLFSGPIRPATWPYEGRNRVAWFSAPASAFAWNDNCIEVRVVPTRAGDPAAVQVRPRSAGIRIDNRTRTVGGKAGSGIQVTRSPDSNAIIVTGSYAVATSWYPLAIHEDPDLLAGEELAAALRTAGIPVEGRVRLGPVAPAGPLLIDEAHPLLPALTVMNQRSQNFYAEQVLRVLGYIKRGEGSIEAGRLAAIEALRPLLGEEADTIQLLDGCGLSYGNRAPAGTLARLLAALARPPHGERFVPTLKPREPSQGRGWVKTGTHAQACTLAGYVDRAGGERWAFAFLFNRGSTRDLGWADSLRDQLFRLVAAD